MNLDDRIGEMAREAANAVLRTLNWKPGDPPIDAVAPVLAALRRAAQEAREECADKVARMCWCDGEFKAEVPNGTPHPDPSCLMTDDIAAAIRGGA